MQALLRPTDSISIHSPVKRETSFRILHFPQCTDFNPLPRKEGDEALSNAIAQLSHFNPLPRKEGDAAAV